MPNALQDKQTTPTRRRVFEDFSVAQIIASVLSTLTSALLSSKIGLIGGLVGAAVGAAVAAAAYQIFKGLLNASADKIREVAPDWVDAATPSTPDTAGESPAASVTPSTTAEIIQSGGRVAPDYYRQLQAEQARKRRWALVATSAAAVLAVAITAFAINVLSAGQGIGTRLTLVPTAQNEQATTSDTSTNKHSTSAQTTTNTDTNSTSTSESTQSNSDTAGESTSNTSEDTKTNTNNSTKDSTDNTNKSTEESSDTGSSSHSSSSDTTSKSNKDDTSSTATQQ